MQIGKSQSNQRRFMAVLFAAALACFILAPAPAFASQGIDSANLSENQPTAAVDPSASLANDTAYSKTSSASSESDKSENDVAQETNTDGDPTGSARVIADSPISSDQTDINVQSASSTAAEEPAAFSSQDKAVLDSSSSSLDDDSGADAALETDKICDSDQVPGGEKAGSSSDNEGASGASSMEDTTTLATSIEDDDARPMTLMSASLVQAPQKVGFVSNGDGTVSYYAADGSMVKSKEVCIEVEESTASHPAGWYYFDSKGIMATGEFGRTDDTAHTGWYYFDRSTGVMQHGWMFLSSNNGKWVYYDPYTGIMHHGECAVTGSGGDGWCYFDDVTGATTYGWKYLSSNGGKWVYYDPTTGRMCYGERAVTGSGGDGWCYFDDVTGATTYGWKYLSSNGGKWVYYHPQTGRMLYGEQAVAGSGGAGWCYFDDLTGATSYGWHWLNSNGGKIVFYNTQTGRMVYGSQQIGGLWYWFDPTTGALAANLSTYRVNTSAYYLANMHNASPLNVIIASSSDSGSRAAALMELLNLSIGTKGRNTVTADQLNAVIAAAEHGNRGSLHGQGQAIINAANDNHINAVYLLAHAAIESNWGRSSLARGNYYIDGVYYNFFGYGAVDDNPYYGGMDMAKKNRWNTVQSALSGAAKTISTEYINYSGSSHAVQRTLYEMRWDPLTSVKNGTPTHEYASDQTWATSIAQVMAQIYRSVGGAPSGTYIVPVYW